ncbi:MAG: DUF2254 domain-containing protein [Vicinamibacteria bacterium]|nr:DUF2254 domain-containing protein [Vicinamibacteria bacterium]
MNKFRAFWGKLRGSFWLVPTLILAVSIEMAVVLIEADSMGMKPLMARWPWLFGAGAVGARGMLSTIAGSMMTVVGVTFSMTLMTLALASSQYTSRILRNFMSDRVTQFVLGTFAGVFTYCLIVLRTIRGGDEGSFIPGLAVSFAVVLAIGAIGVLIFFIHHIASAIQASNIIASVGVETLEAVDRLFPERLGDGADDLADEDLAEPPLPERAWRAVPAPKDGYIQGVDNEALVRLACQQDTIVRMERGIGEFVVKGTMLAFLALEDEAEQEAVATLQSAYTIDRRRTVEQDAGFGIRQIVDIALRALSPGINDTTTAVMCVDHLSAILTRLASRPIPSPRRYEEGTLRVITVGPNFASLTADSFDEIRGSAKGNLSVLLRMLGALQIIGSVATRTGRRRTLREQVELITEVAGRTLESPYDRAKYERTRATVREALETPPVYAGPKRAPRG